MTYTEAIKKANKKSIDVANYLGLSKQCWSNKENYQRQLTADELLRFCDFVKCKVRDLKIKGYKY